MIIHYIIQYITLFAKYRDNRNRNRVTIDTIDIKK